MAGNSPFELLNAICPRNLETVFPNVYVALRIICTLPVSVAGAERSISMLSIIKNDRRSCSTQGRISGLATLYLQSELAKQLDVYVYVYLFHKIGGLNR